MTEILFCLWLIIISVTAVAVTVWDKHAAKARLRRIPEATLLWIAFFGGAAAMLATMQIIRHKTRKLKFMIGLPLMLVLHILLTGVLLIWCLFTPFLPI